MADTTTFYKVSDYSLEVEEVEVQSFTDKSIILANGHRVLWETSRRRYFQARVPALRAIEHRLRQKISSLEAQLAYTKKSLARFRKEHEL